MDKHKNNQLRGSLLIAISALFYASYGLWSKLMIGTFGEFNQAWIRAVMLLSVLIPFGLLTNKFKKISANDWKWFIAISIVGGLNQAPYFWGFENLPVATATVLFYLSLTLGTYIIGGFFFKEKLTIIKYISFLLGFAGVAVIYSFSLSPSQTLPAISTITAGFMGATFVVFSKKISSNYTETQILTALVLCVFVGNGIISLVLGEQTPSFTLSIAWIAQLCYAVSYLLANMAVIAGFKHLEPSIGGIIGLLEVVFATVLGVIIFGEVITSELIIGSLLILVAAGLADGYRLIKRKYPRRI
ncbi:hypothetical protein A3A93_05430 [Candidatus Roizmanbacteria bacterium RIFCSPLOWO2_01_FULL_38_12]|uniref:EamA domain-containing protein n=1 Tax=Candidatus Roizmanbacteria bacterium RIFCSPLOWO2_01_FULL_38_12 TaxID=1802061 RepID=A0A1F7IZ38_9BACT|nr:MAG: hypothetical protein A2861_03645 [Candidatus Roizmanbacteria bacterium RIFCSPHIGHO2_01_FULL_38_15]OGK35662.1 MAG: hypothetical protein A3F59_01860 [Candidatus Roizmanbacteria bacterium RIFCSPHIGHO2_12_FULL_38_13]OGK48628.1 MAG: hypothetical protein A3A93_05430 [Candidatus Roizmanbacteria bacterium RIFCSPLOWO2_01_FULL_38_12]